jgi:hypothetical protein
MAVNGRNFRDFHFYGPNRKGEDRREMYASLPARDEGTDGEKGVDIDSILKRCVCCELYFILASNVQNGQYSPLPVGVARWRIRWGRKVFKITLWILHYMYCIKELSKCMFINCMHLSFDSWAECKCVYLNGRVLTRNWWVKNCTQKLVAVEKICIRMRIRPRDYLVASRFAMFQYVT